MWIRKFKKCAWIFTHTHAVTQEWSAGVYTSCTLIVDDTQPLSRSWEFDLYTSPFRLPPQDIALPADELRLPCVQRKIRFTGARQDFWVERGQHNSNNSTVTGPRVPGLTLAQGLWGTWHERTYPRHKVAVLVRRWTSCSLSS